MANETEPASPVETAGGCALLLFLIFLLGRCVFGGSDEPTPSTPVASIPDAAPPKGPPTGSNILEQAILDAFPPTAPKTKAAKETAKNAADYVGAAINAAGHLCAKPIEARQAATGQYGIRCAKYRNGSGMATYLVDVRTRSVDEI
jgi:hypothetical protein